MTGESANWVDAFIYHFTWFVEIEKDYLVSEVMSANVKTAFVSMLKTFDINELGRIFEGTDLPKIADKLIAIAKDIWNNGTERNDRIDEEREYHTEYIVEYLYGLVHAHYILTTPGLMKMAVKFHQFAFGHCPRAGCHRAPVLLIGVDTAKNINAKAMKFCPLCHDLYVIDDVDSKDVMLKGVFFGDTFPSLFMVTFPEFSDEGSYVKSLGPDIWMKGNEVLEVCERGKKEKVHEAEKIKFQRYHVVLHNE